MSLDLPNSDRLPFDIRAEVLARLLMEKRDLDIEQIGFRPQNFYQRWGRRDVLDVSEGYSNRSGRDLVWLDVSREGLFDTLPEGLFFHPDDGYGSETSKVKALTQQEAAARKFLSPFEQVFYWLQLENELRESGFENHIEAWWQQRLRTEQSELDHEQRAILMQLLPHLPNIMGNWPLTAQWLKVILGESVRIVEIAPPQYNLPDDCQKRLGEGVLGQDFVIGRTFSDGIAALSITIEELTTYSLIGFLEGGKNRRILEDELLGLLLPVETPYCLTLQVQLSDEMLHLGDTLDLGNGLTKDNNTPILGFTRTAFAADSEAAQSPEFQAYFKALTLNFSSKNSHSFS